MATAVVTDSHIKFSGVTYFRGRAEDVEVGSYGEIRKPITKMNYLEVKGKIPASKIGAAKSTVVEIDTSKTSNTAFSAIISTIVEGIPVKLQASEAYKKIVDNQLKLVKFSVPNNVMIRAVNDSPKALNNLKNYGNNARIAHQVFFVMEAKLATKFDNDVSVDLSAGKGPLEATVGGSQSSQGKTTVTISEGAGFAYLLAKIDWNKDKTKVVDLNDDQWSFG